MQESGVTPQRLGNAKRGLLAERGVEALSFLKHFKDCQRPYEGASNWFGGLRASCTRLFPRHHERTREYQRSASQKLHAQRSAERTATRSRVVNLLLWWDVNKHSGSQDANFMTSVWRGFPLVGEIEPSHLWSSSHQATLSSMRVFTLIALCEPGGCHASSAWWGIPSA